MKHSVLSSHRAGLSRSQHVLSIFLVAGMCILPMSRPAFAADPLPPNTVKGTFTPGGKPGVTLTNAAAFVDKKDSDKPTILILSDKKLPTEKWTSEFDLMMSHPTFTGVIFWLKPDGTMYRCDTYDKGQQASVSGYFKLKFDGALGKDLTGSVASNEHPEEKDPRVDATFHAVVP